MSAGDNQLGMVVNFFAGRADDSTRGLIVSATDTALRLLQRADIVSSILVVDGTSEPCRPMRAVCEALGVAYHHAGRGLSYVEAYNIGWRQLTHEFVGLMANDVAPHPAASITRLLDCLRDSQVGCVFPYLATVREANDETQQPGFFGRGRHSCEPASMTLNLNLFRRAVLESIGGLDERYRVGYQEPLLLIKIRSLGYRAVMVGGTRALHYDGLNKATGATETSRSLIDEDTRRWHAEHPGHADPYGLAHLKLWATPFSTSRRHRALWWAAYHLPRRLRSRGIAAGLAVEPWFCRYVAASRTPPA